MVRKREARGDVWATNAAGQARSIDCGDAILTFGIDVDGKSNFWRGKYKAPQTAPPFSVAAIGSGYLPTC